MTLDLILENQLKQYLCDEQFLPQQRLPSERLLSQEFGVQRLTLRVALQRLKDQGILNVRKNSGYYLAEPRVPIVLGKPHSYFDSRSDQPCYTLPLNFFKTEFGSSIMHKFSVSDPTGYCIIGLQTQQQIPYGVITTLIPAHCIPSTDFHDYQEQNLFALYEQNQQKIVHTNEQISSCAATEVESFLLGVPPQTDLVYHHVYSHNAKGQCILIQKIVYLSDRVEFQGW